MPSSGSFVTMYLAELHFGNGYIEIGLLISSLHANLLYMNFTKFEHVFVGSTWKRYKNFPIDGANARGVKNCPLSSVRSKYSNITAN